MGTVADVVVVRTNHNTIIHNAVRKVNRKIRVQSHSDIPEKVVFGDLILVATSVGILIINIATASTVLAGVTSDFKRIMGYPIKSQLSGLLGLALFLFDTCIFTPYSPLKDLPVNNPERSI